MQPVSIIKGSIQLAGLLFQPNITSGSLPGVVVIHPGGGVKEQTASVYAERLSHAGYVTIAFDASHQGDSGGLPYHLEDPNARTLDASAVVDYLERLDIVDSERIVVLGICAGGGHAVAAATGDHRIKAAAIVSAVNIGDSNRLGWYGNETAASKIGGLDAAAERIRNESTGAEPGVINYVPQVNDTSAPPDLQDAADYYLTARAQHPNAQNIMLDRSMPLLLNYDAFAFAEAYFTQPLLIIAGEQADSRWHSEKLAEILDDRDNVRKVIVPGGRHMDFYDIEEYVGPAVQQITDFFRGI
ncbi:alpha/beta-hydrolase [Ophiobolus disseminans]|uniref:Alpha/beta-hydrolase n=1 Tax=Ophiobolus disseminans TaxID=1469910 RepID=A0A6A6ZU74_9PLEO|nr:alpha/beta-hydrolase [Ophiobolus disseminans]